MSFLLLSRNLNTLFKRFIFLQRGRDSNPRYPFEVYTLSRRAPSTTRPPLCGLIVIFKGDQITKKKLNHKTFAVNFRLFLL